MRAIYDDCKIDILCIESHLECHLLYTDRGRGLNVGVFFVEAPINAKQRLERLDQTASQNVRMPCASGPVAYHHLSIYCRPNLCLQNTYLVKRHCSVKQRDSNFRGQRRTERKREGQVMQPLRIESRARPFPTQKSPFPYAETPPG